MNVKEYNLRANLSLFLYLSLNPLILFKFQRVKVIKSIQVKSDMVKTTFQQIYDKSIKFYDFNYHLHKSTFKGLSTIFKSYSDCEKQYSSRLIRITQQIPEEITDLTKQMPVITNIIRDIIEAISTISQLHFNYSERLRQIGTSLNSEYNQSKRKKEKHMKILRDQFTEKLQKVKQQKNRPKLNEQEQYVCKMLYQNLDTYMDQQVSRSHKVQEQAIIYFTLSKKISQKQLELVNKYKMKVAQNQMDIKVPGIDQISQMLVEQHNGYRQSQGGDSLKNRISAKKYDKMQAVQITRQSLKQSMILRQKIFNIQNCQSNIRKSLQKYQIIPQNLMQLNLILKQKQNYTGLFDKTLLKHWDIYSRQIKTQTLKQISFQMLEAYFNDHLTNDVKVVLNIMKGNLKIKSQNKKNSIQKLSQFLQYQLTQKSHMEIDSLKIQQNKNYVFHIGFMIILNQIYCDEQKEKKENQMQNQKKLLRLIKFKQFTQPIQDKSLEFHILISSVLLKYLINTLFTINSQEELVIDGYVDFLDIICEFGRQFLGVNQNLVKLMFLQILERNIRITKSIVIEKIEDLFETFKSKSKMMPKTKDKKYQESKSLEKIKEKLLIDQKNYQQIVFSQILMYITEGIINFFQLSIPLINFVKILICLQKVAPEKHFSAVEHFHKCIKRSGYQYILWIDQDKKITQPSVWQGELRLKNLVEVMDNVSYQTIQQTHFQKAAQQLSDLLGVDKKIISRKINQQFNSSLCEIIRNNLEMLNQQGGIDKQGYVLKLGVYLAQLNFSEYNSDYQEKYFKVLQTYLTSTEKQYSNLLQHSWKTQLWIMEQNSTATQNCIDFCSLLYKPFQFLLTTLKALQAKTNNKFSQKFSQFIKNRLNSILKDQIVKYIQFLFISLKVYFYEEPVLYYKQKYNELIQSTPQSKNKEKYMFRQMVRRVYNLVYLKDQLNEIISDFLENEIYSDLGGTIFDVRALQIAISRYKQHKQILSNLRQIVVAIQNTEEKILYRMADITIFHFLKRFFSNLYWQQQKGAFEEFFSSKSDYKLSEHTLIKYQNQIQELFVLIQRNIPMQVQEKYYQRLGVKFFRAYRLELLNNTKFKIPKKREQINIYLDKDISFIITLFKQKFMPLKIVQDYIEKPVKELLNDFVKPTQKLIQMFETDSLKGNNQGCKYIFTVLYLRLNDDKATQFLKKYKTIIFK